jgi:hypothetical protein
MRGEDRGELLRAAVCPINGVDAAGVVRLSAARHVDQQLKGKVEWRGESLVLEEEENDVDASEDVPEIYTSRIGACPASHLENVGMAQSKPSEG